MVSEITRPLFVFREHAKLAGLCDCREGRAILNDATAVFRRYFLQRRANQTDNVMEWE